MSNSVVPVCRVCLADDIKMYSIRNTLYQEMFEKLSGSKLVTKDGRPHTVCYICHAHLRRISAFCDMTLSSERQLTAVLKGARRLTKKKTALLEKAKISLSVTFTKTTSTVDESALTKTVIDHLRHEHSYCLPTEYITEESQNKPCDTQRVPNPSKKNDDIGEDAEEFSPSLYDEDILDQSQESMDSSELDPPEEATSVDLIRGKMVKSNSLSPTEPPTEIAEKDLRELIIHKSELDDNSNDIESTQSGNSRGSRAKVTRKKKKRVNLGRKRKVFAIPKNIAQIRTTSVETQSDGTAERLFSDSDRSQAESCESHENISTGSFDYQTEEHWVQGETAKARLEDETSDEQAKEKPMVEMDADNKYTAEIPNENDMLRAALDTQIQDLNELSKTQHKGATSPDKSESGRANEDCMPHDKDTHLIYSDTGVPSADDMAPEYESEDDLSQISSGASTIGLLFPGSNPDGDNSMDISINTVLKASDLPPLQEILSGMMHEEATSEREDISGSEKVVEAHDNYEDQHNKPNAVEVKKAVVPEIQPIEKMQLRNKLSNLKGKKVLTTDTVKVAPRMSLRSKSVGVEGMLLRANSKEKSNSIEKSAVVNESVATPNRKGGFKTPPKRKTAVQVKSAKKPARVVPEDKTNAMAHLDDELERFINEVDVKVDLMELDDAPNRQAAVKAASKTAAAAPAVYKNIDTNKATDTVTKDEQEPSNSLDVSVTLERKVDEQKPTNNNKPKKKKQIHKVRNSTRNSSQNDGAKDLEEIYEKTLTVKHFKGVPFRCEICKRRFKTAIALKTHKADRHKSTCFVCGKTLSNTGHLKTHMLIHTGEKPFACKVCGKRTNNKSNLTKHMAVHTGNKLYCKRCHRVINGMTLKDHNLKMHPDQQDHQCSICAMTFTTQNSLKLHIKSHNRKAPFSCDLCTEKFNHMILLKRHIFNMHIL